MFIRCELLKLQGFVYEFAQMFVGVFRFPFPTCGTFTSVINGWDGDPEVLRLADNQIGDQGAKALVTLLG